MPALFAFVAPFELGLLLLPVVVPEVEAPFPLVLDPFPFPLAPPRAFSAFLWRPESRFLWSLASRLHYRPPPISPFRLRYRCPFPWPAP